MRALLAAAATLLAAYVGIRAGYALGSNDRWVAGIRAEQARVAMGGARVLRGPRFER